MILLLIALSTANRVLVYLIAAAATLYLLWQKIMNPVYWALTALAWLLGLLWGSSFVQSIYTAVTGQQPNPPPQVNLGGTNNG